MTSILQKLLLRFVSPQKREHFKMMSLLLLRAAGLLGCTAVALLFGAVPFAVGAGIQMFMKKRAPGFLVGVLAAAAVLGVWWATGWVQIHFGPNAPAWVTVGAAMYLGGSVFAAIGAHVVRFFVHRQFLPKP